MRYGQRHAVEIEAARRVARALGVARHVELEIDLRGFGGSALTSDCSSQGPKRRRDDARNSRHVRPGPEHRLSVTRSGLGRDAGGVRHLDRRQLRRLLGLSRLPARVSPVVRGARQPGDARGRLRHGRFRIHAPLLTLNKEQIIERGRAAGRGLRTDPQLLRSEPEGLSLRTVRCLPDPPVGIRPARARDPIRLRSADG